MRILQWGLVGLLFVSCGGRDRSVDPVQGPAGKVSGGGLFDLFKEGGSAIVGVDSTAAETPADSTAAAVTDTLEAAVADTTDLAAVLSDTTLAAPAEGIDTMAALTAAEARAKLARQGIPYTAESFVSRASGGNLAVVRLFCGVGYGG